MEKVKKKTLFYFILGLILLRPSLDIFSQYEFRIHQSLPYININTIIGGFVFWIGLIVISKNIKRISSIPLFYPISLFLGLCFASIFYSLNVFESIKEFIRISSIFLLYFLAYISVKEKKDWFLLLKIVLISYILPGALAIIQLIFNLGLPDDFAGFSRIYGTFAHPNPFSFYTFFILGLVICMALIKKEQLNYLFSKNPYILFGFGLTFLLLATYSRSALACLFIFLLFFGVFRYRKLLLLGLAVFLGMYLFSDVFQQRILELITLDPYGSIIWRLRFWKDMLPISFWQPWFGYGLGAFNSLAEFYRGFEWGSLDAHNDYLKIFVENGITGLITYFWLIIGLMVYLIKIFKQSVGQDKIFALGLLAISLSLFIASFFDNVLRTTALQWNLWILLAGWLKVKK
ncbi:MAG: O-antigen ligase family protein [bacterium]